MQLSDFLDGNIPAQLYGWKCETTQIEQWYHSGFIVAHGTLGKPNFRMDTWHLTDRGRQQLDGIDVSRLPYKRGQDAYHGGLARTWHETADANKHGTLTIGSGSHRHWVAGWDAAKKAEEAK